MGGDARCECRDGRRVVPGGEPGNPWCEPLIPFPTPWLLASWGISPSWDLMDGSVCALLSYRGELLWMGGRPSLWLFECMLAVGDLISIFSEGVCPESLGEYML
jgi:hypothetical protein